MLSHLLLHAQILLHSHMLQTKTPLLNSCTSNTSRLFHLSSRPALESQCQACPPSLSPLSQSQPPTRSSRSLHRPTAQPGATLLHLPCPVSSAPPTPRLSR